jgi:hypothetical protein
MSDLTFIEKRKLEQLFGMSSGYVLGFSNRTFEDFFIDCVGANIGDPEYAQDGHSKANRLRAFWNLESNLVVGKVISGLLNYVGRPSADGTERLLEECRAICSRLTSSAPVPDLAAIEAVDGNREFEILVKSVHTAIENDEPEGALDRLHTYTVKFVRSLCERHGVSTDRAKPLHSIFGEYVKLLSRQGHIRSKMTNSILKSSISILQAFNEVRNEQSLAHDNRILSYGESLLICNNIASSIRFLRSLESEINGVATAKQNNDDALPF